MYHMLECWYNKANNITILYIMTVYISDDDDVSDSQPITTVIGGSTYVRWGRTTCGNNSQLLYEG